MSKEIQFKLVAKHTNQRFYESTRPLFVGKGMATGRSLVDCMIEERDTLKSPYKHLIPDDIDGVRIVCISDAHTHTERLVFAGLKFNEVVYGRLGLQISGKYTYMSDGGDINSVYKDEVYLRHLSKLNNYHYKGVIQ